MGRYVEVEKNVSLYVEDIGEGQPIVLIHGWPLSQQTFEYQLNELPKHARVVAIDLRGHGKSDCPIDGYTYDRMADDIRAVIDALDLNNIVLAGFSMGGPIAVRYMTRYAGYRVEKLVLMAAAAPVFTQRVDYPYGMKKAEVDELIQQIEADRPLALAGFGKKFFNSDISKPFSNWFQQIALSASSYGTIQAAVSLRDEDLRIELPAIQVPTLIMHGKKDQICPFEFALEMGELLPNAKLIPFENSGHGLFYDEKEEFNNQLVQFIQSNRTIAF
ncbi:alpha/beta fold hydrolase [Niallia nealsonii]|uniref:Alpha/beta hydrolase n=1 Tax=Niallia nealsonii TaxID=115979 RepID=A0A2N0Z311_9BACI|nr:alpha/beta hydrolase [Niallia nealsonii]PKG23894.1 alpha/beta hydrolase [Niallia nealsonii]